MAVDYSEWNDNIVSRIRGLSNEADIVVVLIHWGEERSPARRLGGQNGGDSETGRRRHHHRHSSPRSPGIRYDGETVTAHSLGNFVFTTRDDFGLA